ncbi:MAG: lysophospholipid acyltransferase family protein [Bacteroidales bacterium]|jgi:putative hemolysin|nr:lysophospholipid acyltransferase family protein [Bacteroidales bacterium]
MKKDRHILISRKELQKILKIKGFTAKCLMNILGLNKINDIYKAVYNSDVDHFIENALELNNNKIVIPEKDLALIPESGSVIFLCNHPFGGWDGLSIIKILLKVRPDAKFLVNFFLSKIEPLQPYLINVNPFENGRKLFSNVAGIKEMHKHIQDGKSLCILPAGEVSTKYGKSKYVEDREWQLNIIKFIKKANVPVISCFIEGQNSHIFHLAGRINPVFRTLRLPKEFAQKKNSDIFIRFSGPMTPKLIQNIDNIEVLSKVLKAKTYCLENNVYSFEKILGEYSGYEAIIEQTPLELLQNEIEKIKSTDFLFKVENYLCFFSKQQDIPNIFREISRLREVTFREIGEGAGKKQDSDNYDTYYNHLFLWDEKGNSIVGAYRIALGREIINKKGIEGFYLNSLFKFDKQFDPYMNVSMEMGRSFIVSEYQKKTLPLFLLWKGIYFVTQKYPEYKYLIGPASISSFYSKHAKILIVEYLKRNYTWKEFSEYVECRISFNYEVNEHHDILLREFGKDLNSIDRLIKDIDINRCECLYS